MGFVAKYGISHIIEMWHLGPVEDQTIFKLARISCHDAVSDDHILADVTPIPNLAILSNPSRTFDHGTVFNDRALANKHLRPKKGLTNQGAKHRRLQTELQIRANFFQGLPDGLHIVENDRVVGLLEIKKLAWGEGACSGMLGRFGHIPFSIRGEKPSGKAGNPAAGCVHFLLMTSTS
jgi:hypothetical protein